jgi:hypothetical protein
MRIYDKLLQILQGNELCKKFRIRLLSLRNLMTIKLMGFISYLGRYRENTYTKLKALYVQ